MRKKVRPLPGFTTTYYGTKAAQSFLAMSHQVVIDKICWEGDSLFTGISNMFSHSKLAIYRLLLSLGSFPASAAIIGLRDAATQSSVFSAAPGSSIDLEVYVDTEGESLEGYYIGLDFAGGPVTIQGTAHQALPGLSPDLFGTPLIDSGSGTIRRLNQITFTAPLDAGQYVVEVITVQLDAVLGALVTVDPGLFGEVLGIGGGACPSGSCSVSFVGAQIEVIPEPGTALLIGAGLLGLALRRPSFS